MELQLKDNDLLFEMIVMMDHNGSIAIRNAKSALKLRTIKWQWCSSVASSGGDLLE